MLLRHKRTFSDFILFQLICIAICLLPPSAFAGNADDIIKKVEHNLNGKTAVMDMSMVIQTKMAKRTMKLESYSIGKEKSFIKILYPGKDKGITFLKINNSMWQYVPRIEKTIKIPASMMLQSWMGSDFTNDDLVKESSLSNDYNKRLLKETDKEYAIELLPNEDAAVVWGKIIMTVSKQYVLPNTVSYYDEDNVLIRELSYTSVKPFGEKFYPTRWAMLPKEPGKSANTTIIEISNAVFDKEVNPSYFTKRALKRYSR